MVKQADLTQEARFINLSESSPVLSSLSRKYGSNMFKRVWALPNHVITPHWHLHSRKSSLQLPSALWMCCRLMLWCVETTKCYCIAPKAELILTDRQLCTPSIYFVDRFHFSIQEAGVIMQDHSLTLTQLSNGFSSSSVVYGERWGQQALTDRYAAYPQGTVHSLQ